MLVGKKDDVIISGQVFEYDLFQYLLSRFKEAFSHSSLSIEEAFKELEDLNLIINTSMDSAAYEYFNCLGTSEKKNINDILRQIIVFKGSRYGVFPDILTGEQRQVDRLYAKYFSYFDAYIHSFIKFDENGDFDKVATFRNLDTLFLNLPRRNAAYTKAYNMQKDSLDAFDYAMSLKEITVKDAIDINTIVNDSDEDKVIGFKRTNNEIIGASFETTDKKNVPFELQRLFSEYRDDFGLVIFDPNEPAISDSERYRRALNIFRKEAEFHIRFERIHPFNDGNGRTGRIILNHHLISQGVAPVILSEAMSEEYRKCINENDIEGLAKLFLYSSSLQIANWVSEKKSRPVIRRKDLAPKNAELAELVGYKDVEENIDAKNKVFGKGFLF